MLAKIDVRDIIRSHYGTLYDNRRERASRADMLLFLAVPVLVAVVTTALGLRLGEAGSLLAAVAVLGGFLFALLILVLQMSAEAAARTEENLGTSPRVLRRVRVLREVSANVAYSVLVSILATTSLAIGDLVLLPSRSPHPGDLLEPPQQPAWISAISMFLLSHLSLTLLMVLRRTYAIAQRELDFASVPEDRDRIA
jgi:hypothetical protein